MNKNSTSKFCEYKSEVEYILKKNSINLNVSNTILYKYQSIHSKLIFFLPIPITAYAIHNWITGKIHPINLYLLILMYCISWIGITVGYHRYFSHKAFKGNNFVVVMLAIFGSMACQGPLNYWVSNHRRHHQCSDREGDIHSPYIYGTNEIKGILRQFWHAHVAWTYKHTISNTGVIASDLLKNKLIQSLNSKYYLWLILGFIVPGVIGAVVQKNWIGFYEGVIWGGFVRLFFTYHTTNTITSLTHMWGSKEFNSNDESRNNIWLAIPTWGEAWHNNHHSFPSSAVFGLHWYQLDLGLVFIRFLQILGLVWDVRKPSKKLIDKKRLFTD